MATGSVAKRAGRLSLLALFCAAFCVALIVPLSVIASQNAYALDAQYNENHVYTSTDESGPYACTKSNWHTPSWAGCSTYDYYWSIKETAINDGMQSFPSLYINNLGGLTLKKVEVTPSDFASVETYISGGITQAKVTSQNKVGEGELYIEGVFSDGCKLKKKVSIHAEQYPFDIKASYTIKRDGEPIVMKYTGSKEGKIELRGFVSLLQPKDFYKITLSDNDATLTLEVTDDIPSSLGESFTLGFATYEREKGDTVWVGSPVYHTVKFICDYSGNSEDNRPITKPTENKNVKELDPQTLRAYTSLLYPFSLEMQGVFSPNTATVASSNPNIADASYTNGTLRINGKKAGSTTLSIKADKALYDYTMKVTVNAVPIKPENIKANSTGMKFATMLGGKNVPNGAEAVIEAKKVSDGNSYVALKQAATNDIIGVYSVNLGVDGKDVHDDFGTIDLTFPVPAEYTNATVRVNHLHEATSEQFKAGEITTEIVPVVNGEATVTVSDLSTFALEANATSVADNTGTGINGNTSTATNTGTTANGKNTTQAGQSTSFGTNSAKLSATGDSHLLFILIALAVVGFSSRLICGIAASQKRERP